MTHLYTHLNIIPLPRILALVCSFPVAMKRRETLAHHIPICNTFATHSGFVHDVTDTDCWAQNGSTHGHVSATFKFWMKNCCVSLLLILYSTPISMPTPICGPTEQQPQKNTICQNSPSAHMPDPTHLITSVSVSPKSCPYHWKRRDKEISLFCVFIFTSDWQKFRVAVSRAFSRFSSVYTLIAGQLCKKQTAQLSHHPSSSSLKWPQSSHCFGCCCTQQ